jgi:hypothetical protein
MDEDIGKVILHCVTLVHIELDLVISIRTIVIK